MKYKVDEKKVEERAKRILEKRRLGKRKKPQIDLNYREPTPIKNEKRCKDLLVQSMLNSVRAPGRRVVRKKDDSNSKSGKA